MLVVKLTSMGDVVHALPAVTDIANALPGAVVDWLVEAPFAAIPALHPAVRRVVPLQWRKWRKSLLRRETWQRIGELRAQLRAERYDLVLDLQGLLKSVLWARQARGPVAGYDRHSAREPLASLFYARVAAVSRDLHAVERCRRLTSLHLGYPLPATPPDFGLRPSPSGWVPEAPAYAVLIPGASRVEKHWPLEHWRALVRRCEAHGLTPVVLWGSPAERELAGRIATGSGSLVPPFLTVGEAGGVLARAALVVGLDTGFTHLAAAFARPTVGIYCDHEPGLAGVTGPSFVRSLGGRGQVPSLRDVELAFDAALAARDAAKSPSGDS